MKRTTKLLLSLVLVLFLLSACSREVTPADSSALPTGSEVASGESSSDVQSSETASEASTETTESATSESDVSESEASESASSESADSQESESASSSESSEPAESTSEASSQTEASSSGASQESSETPSDGGPADGDNVIIDVTEPKKVNDSALLKKIVESLNDTYTNYESLSVNIMNDLEIGLVAGNENSGKHLNFDSFVKYDGLNYHQVDRFDIPPSFADRVLWDQMQQATANIDYNSDKNVILNREIYQYEPDSVPLEAPYPDPDTGEARVHQFISYDEGDTAFYRPAVSHPSYDFYALEIPYHYDALQTMTLWMPHESYGYDRPVYRIEGKMDYDELWREFPPLVLALDQAYYQTSMGDVEVATFKQIPVNFYVDAEDFELLEISIELTKFTIDALNNMPAGGAKLTAEDVYHYFVFFGPMINGAVDPIEFPNYIVDRVYE